MGEAEKRHNASTQSQTSGHTPQTLSTTHITAVRHRTRYLIDTSSFISFYLASHQQINTTDADHLQLPHDTKILIYALRIVTTITFRIASNRHGLSSGIRLHCREEITRIINYENLYALYLMIYGIYSVKLLTY